MKPRRFLFCASVVFATVASREQLQLNTLNVELSFLFGDLENDVIVFVRYLIDAVLVKREVDTSMYVTVL